VRLEVRAPAPGPGRDGASVRPARYIPRVDDAWLARTRAICLALPEVSERLSHGAPTFFIREKRSFVMFTVDHHGVGWTALWCVAPQGVQEQMIAEDPDRFFRPPYVGPSGWLGVRLDDATDWDEVEAICVEGYRTVAPKKLLALLDR
jgi:hypothetical protein